MHALQKVSLGLAALALAGTLSAPPARAQNLVTNPGFETGDFTGWDVTGTLAYVTTDSPHTGNYAAIFGDSSPNVDSLSQTLTTQPGTWYALSFWAETPVLVPPGAPNSLSVSFDGSPVVGLPGSLPDDQTYHLYSSLARASSASADLQFTLSNDFDFTGLDDVSVVAVPEPSALTLLAALCLLGTGLSLRRHGKAVR
jgi:hypothetical protein